MVSHWRTARDVSITQDGIGCCYLAQVTDSKESSKWSRPVLLNPGISAVLHLHIFKKRVILFVTVEYRE
jgi:hypothetical protein